MHSPQVIIEQFIGHMSRGHGVKFDWSRHGDIEVVKMITHGM
jgi:hypothetical protein